MDQWSILGDLYVNDLGHWGLQNYIRPDDEQTDVQLRIPDIERPEEILLKWKPILGGFMPGRTSKYAEWAGSIQLIVGDKKLDEALEILYQFTKIKQHRQSTRIVQALYIRERVREGNSYPFYDPRSAKGNREGLGLQRPRLLRNRRSS